jgi:hypothetical protein
MDINISSQIVVQTAAQWAADNTVYSNKRILVTSDAYYGTTDQRKFKIADGTQTWSNLDYVPIAQTLSQVLSNGNLMLNDSFIKNSTQDVGFYVDQDYIALVGLGASFNGYEVFFIEPNTAGFKSSLSNYVISDAIGVHLNHDTLIDLDAPVYKLTQGTASKFLKTDASKNITYVDDPTPTVNTIGALIDGSTAAVPNDTDLVATADASVLKKITWTNVKAFLKTYFDTIYTTTSAVATQITTALSGYLTAATAASTYEPIFSKNTAFNKNFGTGTTNIVEIGSTLGNSLITSTNANGKLQTLSTTTYPSLTELSYVKGLTSAVQTQLGTKLAKCHTLHFEHTQLGSGAASTTYTFATPQATAVGTGTGLLRRLPAAITGYIYTVSVHSTIQTTVAGSTQQATLVINNKTAGTTVTVGTTIQYDAVGQSYVYTLGTPFAVTAGDDLECQVTMPAWSSTVPAGIIHYVDALIYGF